MVIMSKYLFLVAWVTGTKGADGKDTKVNNSSDLQPQYEAGNPNIFAVEIEAANETIASTYGYAEAFFENYTCNDSVSDIIEIDRLYDHPSFIKKIRVNT